jgi:acetoin utilization deacetylase AcuC-like enzyme
VGHPEQAERFSAVMNALERGGLMFDATRVAVQPAGDEMLELVHTPQYVQLVKREVAAERWHLSTGDTEICPESLDAARVSAGTVVAGVDAVFSGGFSNAFCVSRPPGHHASADVGMGFCLFNNIAIGARYAQKRWGVERVVIVDWDVHHGNGTQDIFYTDGSVLFFSTHQSPWYPGTGEESERGEGKGEGLTLNCPLPAGSGSKHVQEAFDRVLMPQLDEFEPDLVMISAGFDSRIGDPLGRFVLRDDDFHAMTVLLMDVADRHCKGRLVSVLEGGYALDGLARACEAHVRALLGH